MKENVGVVNSDGDRTKQATIVDCYESTAR